MHLKELICEIIQFVFWLIQKAMDEEAAQVSSDYSEHQRDESSANTDKETISLSGDSNNININVENSGSTPQVVLSVADGVETSQVRLLNNFFIY